MMPLDMIQGGGFVPPSTGIADHEVIVDLFAGGGGASEAIFQATGRHPDAAINHDDDAVSVHTANHPDCIHYCQSIWQVKPEDVLPGRPIGLLWLSPDCRHFSRASGGKAKWKSVRSLPGVGLTWAKRRRPRVICLENVPEFVTWGPLLDDGTPCPKRIGRSFKIFIGRLKGLGYTVEWNTLCAADYGAPTTRTRLFMVARCDGKPVRWPMPTHTKKRHKDGQRWRSAAECIDWNRPCPSIFERSRPLAEATLRRIAHGLTKFVLNNPEPFIVTVTHGGDGFRGGSLDEPLPTILGKGRHALVTPFCGSIDHRGNPTAVQPADGPLSTVTAKARHMVVEPFLAGCGGRAAQSPPKSATEPMNTMTTKADQILVTPFVGVLRNNATAHGMDEPIRTVAAQGGHHMLVAPTLIQQGYGERDGQAPRVPGLDKPLGTVVAGGEKHALVSAFIAQHNGGAIGCRAERPLSTITSTATQQQAVMATLSDADEEGAQRVAAFLIRYNGLNIGQPLDEPLGTATTKERFALVEVQGVRLPIVDIGMRMLHWTELRDAQGFPKSYVLDRGSDGRTIGKTTIVRLIGNSVSPPPAVALLRANLGLPAMAEAVAA